MMYDFSDWASKYSALVDNQMFLLGDCLEYMKQMKPQSIDCVVTSPPYNIGVKYDAYHDTLPGNKYLSWLNEVGKEVSRILKPNGSFFLNMGSTNIATWIQFDVANEIRKNMILQNHIIWVKSISIKEDSFGPFKPITSKRFLNQNHEAIFHFTLDGKTPIDRLAVGVPFKYKSNIARRNHAQDKRCAGNIWFIPYEPVKSKKQKFNHPAGFPVELVTKCLKLHGGTGIVLDPFLGCGTTLVAARRLGWAGIGIDIDNKYLNTAIERLKNIEPILEGKNELGQ
jgi:site-specific DNA-methyltransferase (adenine-specific)